MEASRSLGVGIESVCGGKQSCGKCRIRIESGTFERFGIVSLPDHLSQFTEEGPNSSEKRSGRRVSVWPVPLQSVGMF